VILAARSRHHWRGWLLLTLLVMVGTGVVLAAITAGRRADSAFPRFVAAHGYDAIVYANEPLPLAHLSTVSSVVQITAPFHGTVGCSCGKVISDGDFAIREVSASALPQIVKLVSGRMPSPAAPDEALVSFTMQRDYGIGPGTVLRLPMAAASQWPEIRKSLAGTTAPPPKALGPVIEVRVTGIVAAESEFPAGQGVSYDLYPSAAFIAATRSTPALPFYYVRFRHGAADFPAFEATVSGRYGAGVEDLHGLAAAISTSIRPQAVAWWISGALAALAALAATGQALARQAAADSTDGRVLAALGLRAQQFAALILLRTLGIGVLGGLGGVVLATLLSAFVPVGEARLADPTPGLAFDWPVAGCGFAAAVAAVLLLGALPTLRATSRFAGLREPVAARPARDGLLLGLPVSVALGIRRALYRGRGASAPPVRTGLAGSVLAVGALSAIAVFGASLSHLVASPSLYGAPFQAFYMDAGPGSVAPAALVGQLEHDSALDRITLLVAPALTVDGASVRALAVQPVRGAVLLSAADGRLPVGDHEIALGAGTLRSVGAHVGGTVRVAVQAPDDDAVTRTSTFTVVGTLPFPADFGTGGIGTGAALTTRAYLSAECPPALARSALGKCRQAAGAEPTGDLPPEAVLVHAPPGPAGTAALARHAQQNQSTPTVPTALVSFGESANFPLLVAIVVAVCGLATLAHLLAVSVTRRRKESGLLKSLGLSRGQLAAIVFWQAATVAIVGVAVGIPLGLAVGRVIWTTFAANLGVVPVAIIPGWLIAAIGAGFAVTALAIAALPAAATARTKTSQMLRTE
jgi:ABC-type lipoprotein release transport system permease subunit